MLKQNIFWNPSFSIGNQMYRLLWNFFVLFLFRYSPRVFHGWRRFILRSFGAKVGKGVRIYPKVIIWAPWNLVLMNECIIANGVQLYSQGKITIGQRTMVSPGTHLCTGTHDYTRLNFPIIIKPIIIGENAWIAAEVFVHPGITIGDGCVIGARSIVKQDMPGWMVCTGHPCTPVKKRIVK